MGKRNLKFLEKLLAGETSNFQCRKVHALAGKECFQRWQIQKLSKMRTAKKNQPKTEFISPENCREPNYRTVDDRSRIIEDNQNRDDNQMIACAKDPVKISGYSRRALIESSSGKLKRNDETRRADSRTSGQTIWKIRSRQNW